MIKKELLKKLIAHYKKVIKLAQGKTNMQIKEIARENHVYFGICKASHNVFNKNIFDKKWVNSHCKFASVWWFETVYHCKTKERSIKALQNRVDKMKEILKTYK